MPVSASLVNRISSSKMDPSKRLVASSEDVKPALALPSILPGYAKGKGTCTQRTTYSSNAPGQDRGGKDIIST